MNQVNLNSKEQEQYQTQTTELIKLISDATLFHTDTEAYITFSVDNHRETWPLKSRQVKHWLIKKYYDKNKKPPNQQTQQAVLDLLSARAFCETPLESVFIRTANINNVIYLDLCSPEWEVIKITNRGWEKTSECPVKFRRSRGMCALPTPIQGGNINELKEFLNLATNEDLYLIVSWMLGALRGVGPYPILALYGEQGCAKSTTSKVLKSLIDPNSSPLRSAPRKEDDLIIAANNNLALAMDNLSGIPPWLSDALCRISTGGGLSKRELHTDSEEIILEVQRPVILNGIEELATKSDLVDRIIAINLPVIPSEKRKSEEEFWVQLEQARSRLLGVLLDALVAGLRGVSNVTLTNMPRMADFAKWIYASVTAMGWNSDDVLDTYLSNRKTTNSMVLESSIYVPYLKELAETGWIGTASELLMEFKDLYKDNYLELKRLPITPNTLSGALKRIAPNLRAIGIEIETGQTNGTNSERFINIRKSLQKTDATVADKTKLSISDKGVDCDDHSQDTFSGIPTFKSFMQNLK